MPSGPTPRRTIARAAGRLDGIVATIMAIGRAMVAQEEPQPEYSMFFV
jgi:hypothetical protein